METSEAKESGFPMSGGVSTRMESRMALVCLFGALCQCDVENRGGWAMRRFIVDVHVCVSPHTHIDG